MVGDIYCDGKVYLAPVGVFQDARGVLSAIEFTSFDFYPVRAFVVTGAPGAVRGGHGHTKGRQLFVHLSGEVEVEVYYRGYEQNLQLNAVHRALFIESPVWSRQVYRGANPAMVVFCDTPYEPDDYIWTKE